MSKGSPKKRDEDSNSEISNEEDEDAEAMQTAMQEMVKMAEMEEKSKTRRRRSKNSSKDLDTNKNQAEQGAQTIESPEKPKSSAKPDKNKLESEDSRAALFIRRFSWSEKLKSEVTPSADSPKISKKESPKDFSEKIQVFKPKTANKRQSSPETSKESLIHTERYDSSPSTISETQPYNSKLGNEELSEEFLLKLKKIEEASKPKSWVRPKPIVIKPKQIPPTTKQKLTPQAGTEEKHGHINILKAPFQGVLNYAPENPVGNPADNPKENNSENPRENPAENPKENPAEKARQSPATNSDKKSGESTEKTPGRTSSPEHRDSQKTVTISGHTHITTRWGDHCHFHDRDGGVDKAARRKLIIACFLCTGFMVAEIVGGVLSNSLAIATDAAHLLTDLASFLISLFALYLSGRPSSQRLNFGWYRAEVIGAMISVYFIWVLTGY